ncbi:putative Zinc finger, SWIM-type, MULE transposase domain, FHY3/FAR1 family [Helianthus annuus]|nr:putative Zinc finger, SWIM-type, MULE transposase domain, FHY3/FAR1 family [Helianthus annuus]KAJ0530055.1 putative Zinc finger, SWIM-type, MULE transposase domain, FHY3/FAR1 family [Helianthus annuus]KAJ0696913.1 putative Zinc finger, SWIM-type, MULE transposase domain, FHY3/FAR1 family [Helianthus annuus]KAJ0700353.1 putative Zinc finger, SWIM-type, MULE transposase domain, FHY3/FAR1 family [Helianthus annuus]
MMSDDGEQLLVVYDDHSDQRSMSLDETSSTEESPDETKVSLETTDDAIPYIGQRFATHDHAYEFYSEFAKRCGFSIRRHRTEDKNRILMFAKTGISVQQMMRLLELEKCVEPGYLPFTEKDVRNLLQSFRKVDLEDESIDLLRMCRNIKDKDHNFQFEYKLDSNNRLENIAWSYASSVQSYEVFGDAVVFDTTHRLNAFDMPLGIWVGMNNYGMPCFFGCALLREENVKSYSWALKAFLGFMNGKVPQTILTDQTLCVREAIAMEMPSAKHAYCIWLIVAKFPSWFNAVLGERYNEWKSEFYRLYNMESIEDFEMGWRDMVNSFGLHTNRHITTLFAARNLWALPYLRSHFFAGMTTTAHSKAINAFIQRFLSAQTRLAHFIEQVAVAVDFKDQAGEQQTMQQNLQNICLKTGAPMESHAASVLTPFAFSKLQEQLVLAAHYASFQLEDGFLVRHHTKLEGGRKVYWVPREGIISCSCHHFEFSGILCRHTLRVLSTGNCFQIPERYMPLRWRRINTSAKLLQNTLSDHTERVQLLQGMVSNLVTESAKSKDRLDIAMEHVSVLLSRIRDHPVPSSRYARNDCFT